MAFNQITPEHSVHWFIAFQRRNVHTVEPIEEQSHSLGPNGIDASLIKVIGGYGAVQTPSFFPDNGPSNLKKTVSSGSSYNFCKDGNIFQTLKEKYQLRNTVAST